MVVAAVFANAQQTVPMTAGQVLFREGDAGDHMFGVISGAVGLYKGQTPVAKVDVGGVFGEIALIERSPRTLTAMAVEDTVLAVIDRQHFLFLVHETPSFALQVMASLAERLRAHDPA